MEKSNVDKLRDALLYAPVGAFGFLRDNTPTFFSMFVSRGKRDVTKTTASAEEKLSSTKEHGQFVAMCTPVMRTRAEKLTSDAKQKGEDIAHVTIDVALGALNFLESAVKSLANNVAVDTKPSQPPMTSAPVAEPRAPQTSPQAQQVHQEQSPQQSSQPTQERSGHIDSTSTNPWTPEFRAPVENAEPHVTHFDDEPTFTPDNTNSGDFGSAYNSAVQGEGDFIAEPLNTLLPANIKGIYERLSAPEIIDRLDDYVSDDLANIRSYETDYRNRQTIIHAINYRLNEKP